jgi:O-antigen/teichoic acid export membrane protein
LSVSLAAVTLGTVGLSVLGRDLLGTFGQAYAVSAYPAVVILAVSTLPLAIKDHWISIQRISGNVRQGAVVGVGTLVLEVLASYFGALFGGIVGLSTARLCVLAAQALLMIGPVLGAMTRPPAQSLPGLPGPAVSRARVQR